jgi:pilus assembly protein Flp/PilA
MIHRFHTIQAWLLARRDERGATAVEYGIMVALIAAVIIVAVQTLGVSIDAAFDSVNNVLP